MLYQGKAMLLETLLGQLTKLDYEVEIKIKYMNDKCT